MPVVNARAPFTPADEATLADALMTGLAEKAEAGSAGRLHTLAWLARVLWRHERSSTTFRVAAHLADAAPDFDDVRLRDIVRATHVGETEVSKALDLLHAGGFIDLRPSVRIGAARIKLLR